MLSKTQICISHKKSLLLLLFPHLGKAVREEENCRMHESIEADAITASLLRGKKPGVPLLYHLPDPSRASSNFPVPSFGNHCTFQCTDLLTSLAQLVYIFLTVRKLNCVPSWKGPKWIISNLSRIQGQKRRKRRQERENPPL